MIDRFDLLRHLNGARSRVDLRIESIHDVMDSVHITAKGRKQLRALPATAPKPILSWIDSLAPFPGARHTIAAPHYVLFQLREP